MLEGADNRDRRLMLRLSPHDCPHCGQDRRDPRYSWRNGTAVTFGCCPKMLQETHGADPTQVIAQRTGYGLFGGRVAPNPTAILSTPPR